MDVIALNNHGIENAVASLGTALTVDQAKLIKRYSQSVYICYDSDEAGVKASQKAIDIFLSIGIKAKIIELGENLDPDDFIKKYGKDEFMNKIESAMDVYNYQYNRILDIYANANPNEKYEKLDLFVEFLANIDSDLTREIFVNNVSTLFNIDKSTLNKAIQKYNTNTRSNKIQEKNKKVIVKSNPQKYNSLELEILRLIVNQKDDYENNREILDKALTNEKIINVRDFLINEDKGQSKLEDEDYKYIFTYIRDAGNPIVVEELLDKIKLYERRKKLKELKSLKKGTKGNFNE